MNIEIFQIPVFRAERLDVEVGDDRETEERHDQGTRWKQ